MTDARARTFQRPTTASPLAPRAPLSACALALALAAALALALALALAALPAAPARAEEPAAGLQAGLAAQDVAAADDTYIERSWDSVERKVVETVKDIPADAVEVTSGLEKFVNGKMYVVSGEVSLGDVESEGGFGLVLRDGAKLETGRILANGDQTISVYGQKGGTGTLAAAASAAIYIGHPDGGPCGTLVVHGGTVIATGESAGAGIGGDSGAPGGTVTVYGGTVVATGGSVGGAGIGGGQGAPGGTVTVYGGTVVATVKDGEGGAGIGGGTRGAGGTVTVHGGTVVATVEEGGGAGIGGGDRGAGGTFAIYGGTVVANVILNGGAGIGGGDRGAGGTVTVHGGTVTALGGEGAEGIGRGLAEEGFDPPASGSLELGEGVSLKGRNGAAGAWSALAAGDRARWMTNADTSKKLKVSFDANGRGTAPAAQEVDFLSAAPEPAAMSAEGYTVEGWYTGAACAAWQRHDFSSPITSDLALYAKWVTTYTVSFDANGGAGEMSDQGFAYDAGQALSANEFTREGHEFAGWNTEADGTGVSYSDGELVKNLTKDPGGKVTLYAQWKGPAPLSFAAGTVAKAYGDGPFVNELANPSGVAVSYGSSDEAVATVDGAGEVTVRGAGTAEITATFPGDETYAPAQASYTLDVAKAASGVKLAAQGKTYTGKALAYTGKVTRTGSSGKVTFRYYSDAACKKAVAVSAVRGAGTYYVVAALAADANYLAATSAPVRLTVAKAAGALKVAPAKKALSAKPGKKTTIKAKKAFKVKANASKGKVTYAKVKGAKKISVSKAGKVTVKKGLKAGKTYTVKVRATAAATANYRAASAVVALKVKVQKKKK